MNLNKTRQFNPLIKRKTNKTLAVLNICFTYHNSKGPSQFLHINIRLNLPFCQIFLSPIICTAYIHMFNQILLTAHAVLLLTIPWFVHEVSLHLFLVCPKIVFSEKFVAAIVDVCGVVQLQAAMILSLCDVMDHGQDVKPFHHCFTILEPLKFWLWVS